VSTRLILLEVADTQTQDDIHMAIAIWNERGCPSEDRKIRIIQETSLIVGES